MASTKELIESVRESFSSQVAPLGFRLRASGIYTRALSAEVDGWMGVPDAYYPGGTRSVSIFVGASHRALERRFAELAGLKHRVYPPTIRTNLGYLTPKHRYANWDFDATTAILPQVAEMVACLAEFGMPYMERHGNLDSLYSALLRAKRGAPPEDVDYRLPLAAELLGKHREANSYVEATLRELGDRADSAAGQFRSFAQKFRAS